MKTSKFTRRVVRAYVPLFRRISHEDLYFYWTHGHRLRTREGAAISLLAFREMMRRKRLDNRGFTV